MATLMETLKMEEFSDIAELCVNLNFGIPTFIEQQQEDLIILQDMLKKKMNSLRKFRLVINCIFEELIITNIHYKHITDLMNIHIS